MQTHKHTDRKVKTEGPKILSRDIFYLQAVIIGSPISKRLKPSIFYIFNVDLSTECTVADSLTCWFQEMSHLIIYMIYLNE